MFYLLYNITSVFLLVPVLVYHLYRSFSRGRSPGLAERFGMLPSGMIQKINKRPVIWLHAVSVGEAMASRPLLKALRQRYPDHALLISTTTETGRSVASTFTETDGCFYFPFDFLPAVRSSLATVNPRLIIIMETEIWPNFTREAAQLGIPLLLANGRISDRSFGRYRRLSWFFRHPLELFSALCMQTEVDSERIITIGAPDIRTITCGNLKYDIPCNQPDDDTRTQLRLRYALPPTLTVLVAASTHPGEEALILPLWRQLAQQRHDLLFVLVPRHPERATDVAALIQAEGMICRRRTTITNDSITPPLMPGEILLVDTVGELMTIYALADLAFVGGSLVPTGGHNLLEPASLGIPVIFGPHMSNFREITALTLQYGAGVQVADSGELLDAIHDFLASKELRQVIGGNGLKMLRANGGATQRIMDVAASFL